MPLDITISPLYRVGGQDQPSLPGLMAAAPPRQAARGRHQDRLIVHLSLAGNAVLSSGECVQAASRAAVAFYATPGTITSALRNAAQTVNKHLRDRNLAGPAPGAHAVGVLALAGLRESQLTLLLSGPMQAFFLAAAGARRIGDTRSGRGLGLGTSTPHYFARIDLKSNDRVVLCGDLPDSWETALANTSAASLEATRRRLMTATADDISAVLLQATDGTGVLRIQRLPATAPTSVAPAGVSAEVAPELLSHATSTSERRVQPSASETGYQAVSRPAPLGAREPAAKPTRGLVGPAAYGIPPEQRHGPRAADDEGLAASPSSGSSTAAHAALESPTLARGWISAERQRQAARRMLDVLQAVRKVGDGIGRGVRNFLPRLLPASEQGAWAVASPAMMFIAVLVPLLVVTMASAVYFRYGRSVQYEQYLVQARDSRLQALSLTDPVAQREAWQRVLFYLDKAEDHSESGETRGMRTEAQHQLDEKLGIVRLQFQPVLSRGVGAQIGRLAAGENDLYLLDAQRGAVMHLALTDSGFQVDSAFNCAPGSYGDYTVGPLVDILALPALNTIDAAMVGVDAQGNLLYCRPGQLAQAIPLPTPDTNWGRVKAISIDAGNLYVLDSQAHAIWVYVGKDGAFVDRPYFFFGGQIPELEDAIDMAVSADDLYVLHSDGRLSTCSYSRIEAVPTRCIDPAQLVNPFEAYREQDLFTESHFTQMMFSPAPEAALLLLDADSQGVLRFSPRSLELQSQMRPLAGRANTMPRGEVTAVAISANHVLYYALQDRIYFAADTP
jgi:hypothetical protein